MQYTLDWLNLVVRWSHEIAGISWIGASLYFVWLDNHLKPPRDANDAQNGVFGELWAVHGGGFYHNQKFMTGPRREPLTEDLHWFKWEAYTTWLSGVLLLAIVYWAGAGTYLIDKSVLDLSAPAAIGISIATLVLGWVVYDALCRLLGRDPRALAIAVAAFVLAVDYVLFHVFGGRAAYLHVGAMMGTIMVANVFFVIIPGQRKMLAQIRAGERPDPRPGINGKIRSVHNTYFTFPVLFIMISNHFPMTYANANGWLVLAAISAAGVMVRQFFVLGDKARYLPALPAAAAAVLFATAFAIAPHPAATAGTGPAPAYATVAPIIALRCAVCHAAHPTQPGFASAPEGVLLDSREHIVTNAQRIYAQAVASHAMPIGNVTHISDAEARDARRLDRGRSAAAMTLSTHVLDTARGVPAAGIPIALYAIDGSARRHLADAITNADGRTDAPLATARSPPVPTSWCSRPPATSRPARARRSTPTSRSASRSPARGAITFRCCSRPGDTALTAAANATPRRRLRRAR